MYIYTPIHPHGCLTPGADKQYYTNCVISGLNQQQVAKSLILRASISHHWNTPDLPQNTHWHNKLAAASPTPEEGIQNPLEICPQGSTKHMKMTLKAVVELEAGQRPPPPKTDHLQPCGESGWLWGPKHGLCGHSTFPGVLESMHWTAGFLREKQIFLSSDEFPVPLHVISHNTLKPQTHWKEQPLPGNLFLPRALSLFFHCKIFSALII